MNRKKEQLFSNLNLPKVRQMSEHKRRLRVALLSAHQERSGLRTFGYVVNYHLKTMSTLQKRFALLVIALVVVVGAAGIFGPSASSIVNAQAQENINRAYARLANLSDEERAQIKEEFQGKMFFKYEVGGKFLDSKDLSPEELETRHEQMKEQRKEGLTEALAEAQTAPDLRVVSADELPVSGFFGRAGRAFGFKMMHESENREEKFANLPEDVRQKIEEHRASCEGEECEEHEREMEQTSFMVYTNADGQTVYLGLDENDEPVMKFVQPKDGETSSSPRGKKIPFKSGESSE